MKPILRSALRIKAGGRIVIPAAVRARLGVTVGADLILTAEDDRVTLTSARAARRRACERVRRHIPAGAGLSGELMAERRREAGHE